MRSNITEELEVKNTTDRISDKSGGNLLNGWK